MQKFYFHLEEGIQYTHIFKWTEETATFRTALEQFATAFNEKHGSKETLQAQNLELKREGGAHVPEDAVVSKSAKNGEDFFVFKKAGATEPTPNEETMLPQKRAVSSTPSDSATIKFYMHYEEEPPHFTHIFRWSNSSATVSEILEEFVQAQNAKHGEQRNLMVENLAVQSESGRIIPLSSPIFSVVNQGSDLFVLSKEAASKEDNAPVPAEVIPEGASAIEASKIKAKDKSYYYWKKDVPEGEAAPVEKPKLLKSRELREGEGVAYTTIDKYSFLDDGAFVKVYIELPGVGALPSESFSDEWAERSFCWKVHGYNGRNLRLQSMKLSDEVDPEGCRAIVKNDMVILRFKKKTDKHWFELHKTKGIGES